MTRRGWGWGDYWGAMCVVVALIAGGGLSGGWWIFFLLAGVLGYVGLNVLQARIARTEEWREEVAERERERESR